MRQRILKFYIKIEDVYDKYFALNTNLEINLVDGEFFTSRIVNRTSKFKLRIFAVQKNRSDIY